MSSPFHEHFKTEKLHPKEIFVGDRVLLDIVRTQEFYSILVTDSTVNTSTGSGHLVGQIKASENQDLRRIVFDFQGDDSYGFCHRIPKDFPYESLGSLVVRLESEKDYWIWNYDFFYVGTLWVTGYDGVVFRENSSGRLYAYDDTIPYQAFEIEHSGFSTARPPHEPFRKGDKLRWIGPERILGQNVRSHPSYYHDHKVEWINDDLCQVTGFQRGWLTCKDPNGERCGGHHLLSPKNWEVVSE